MSETFLKVYFLPNDDLKWHHITQPMCVTRVWHGFHAKLCRHTSCCFGGYRNVLTTRDF